jgi:K(+)-stimulated pyrophosphate-energized sodium pump
MNTIMIYLPIVMAIVGFCSCGLKDLVLKQDAGDGKMKEISDYI